MKDSLEERLAIDASSFLWRGLLVGGDPEAITVEHNGKKVKVNSAGWGYENCMNLMLRVLNELRLTPIHMILVTEGINSKSRRVQIDSGYKAGDGRPPEAYVEFAKLRDRLCELWRSLGATIMSQDAAEGDDTLAWLSRELPGKLTIATYDNDLAALNHEPGETNAYGGVTQVWIDGQIGINKYGIFPYRNITVYKALVGDTSDKIKGVPGFGPGKFEDLCKDIGLDGLQELQDMCEAGELPAALHAMAAEVDGKGKPVNKLLAMICAQEESLMRCYRLVKLRPEWVNTLHLPLKIQAGMVGRAPAYADSRIAHWYQQCTLVTAENYADVGATLYGDLPGSPFVAFDIETSSADESDAWLAAQGNPDGVDQMGSTLTGFSFTYGTNLHRTIYVSVDHAQTANIRMSQARELIEFFVGTGLPIVIHNTHFELPVLYEACDEDGTLWRDHWKDNGYHGFLPRALDTKLEASYVDENQKLGLKLRSALHLDYKQVEYDDVTTLMADVAYDGDELIKDADLPAGGRFIGMKRIEVAPAVTGITTLEDGTQQVITYKEAEVVDAQAWQFKMRELPAVHVFDYGCDDTICTAGVHVYAKLVMDLEHTWDVYLDVEIDAAYLHAKNFVDGLTFSLEKSKELERLDDEVYAASWARVRTYLIAQGWEGTQPPSYGADITPAQVKEAYQIVTGNELKTAVRTLSKLVKLIEAEGERVFARVLDEALTSGDFAGFTAYVQKHFKGEPIFNTDSPKQITNLLYEVMGLPVQIRNKPTEIMRAKGLQGNPKTDELAIKYSMRVATTEIKQVLESLWLMKMVTTRRELYYRAYPNFVHWKTGRIHPTHMQCGTNTRRAAEGKPNKTQLAKHQKVELTELSDAFLKVAVKPRYREVIVPHKRNAVIVSMDFNSQELRVIADYSRDDNLVACYVGDNKKDMHSLTGCAILNKIVPEHKDTAYEQFIGWIKQAEVDDEFKKTPLAALIKKYRGRGKTTNFATEYGAMAPKLAATMLVTEEEAQVFIDAREAMFPGVVEWKEGVKEEAKAQGFVKTLMGARRHLRDALFSEDRFEASKAERQAVNFKVQSSCGEMTKKAEGRMWKDNLFYDFDAVCFGPVHDEVVASAVVDERFPEFIRRMHAAMVAPYGGMWVPIVSSISFGPSFGTQFEIGEEPTLEAVQAGLAAMQEAVEKAKGKVTQ